MKKFFALFVLLLAATAMAGNKKPYLGVYLETSDHHHGAHEAHGEASGEKGKGAKVTGVVDGSAASKAGIQSDDLIIEVNGVSVIDGKTLVETLGNYSPDEKVSVKVIRDGEEQTFAVILGERGDFRVRNLKADKWVFLHEDRAYIGIHMEDLKPQLADFFGVDSGILVTEVVEDSPAAKAGLRAGDIIQEWNGSLLENAGDLHELLREAKENDTVSFTVKRKDEMVDVSVTLGARKNNFDFEFDGNMRFEFKNGSGHKTFNIDPKDFHWVEKGDLHENMEDLKKDLDGLKRELDKNRENDN